MTEWTGIHRHGAGWRAQVRVSATLIERKHFPPETSVAVMQAWRADVKAKARVARKTRATRGSFESDAQSYLRAIVALPTIKDRTRQIGLWIAEFGRTPRDRITSRDIRERRDRWLTEHRGHDAKGDPLPPLSASTVNLRLRALSNLYRVLDGPHAPNPVRDVDEAREPSPRERGYDYATIRKILDAVPDLGRAAKGKTRGRSPTKVRLRIMAYTGLPPATIGRLRRDDVDIDGRTMRLPDRQKGRGVRGRTIPILPHAADAFRDLDALNAWGPFDNNGLWKSFQRACLTAGVTPAPVYELRHSFLNVVYDLTGSTDAVMAFGQQMNRETALRYAQRAAAQLLHRQMAVLEAHFAGESNPT
jgi:integrase